MADWNRSMTSDPLVFWTSGWDREPQAKTVPQALANSLVERQVDWIMSTVKWYVLDVLHPLASSAKNIWQWLGWLVFKDLRWDTDRFKNLWKSVLATWVDLSTAAKNSIGWLAWGVDNLYRKNVQDSISEFASWTVDRLWKPGQFLWNMIRLSSIIPWTIPRTLNFISKGIDMPFNYLHKKTRMTWRESYDPVLRV